MVKELSEKYLPRCIHGRCRGKLKKINKTIGSKRYQCVECKTEYKLEKKIGSGYNFV